MSDSAASGRGRWLLLVFAWAGVLVGACVIWLFARYPSLQAVENVVRHEALRVTPRVLDFGELDLGEIATKRIVFQNENGKTVRVIGYSGCDCVEVGRVPFAVPAFGTHHVEIKVKAPANARRVSFTLVFWTDSSRSPELDIQVTAMVVAR